MIEAVLPNGTKLQFPDGTDGKVIRETVSKFCEMPEPEIEKVFLDRVVDFTPTLKSYTDALLKSIPDLSQLPPPEAKTTVEVPVPDVEVKVDAPQITVDVPTPEVKVDVAMQDVGLVINAVNEGFAALAAEIRAGVELQHAANMKMIEAMNKNAGPRTVVRDSKGLIKGIN